MTKLEAIETTEEDVLSLELKGADGTLREYVVQPVSGDWWWKFAALNSVIQARQLKTKPDPADVKLAAELHGKLGSAGMRMLVLGENNVTAMLADGVLGNDIQRAINTAFAWHASGGDNEQAARVWSGKALTPPVISTSTAEEPRTQSPASGTGTTSRRKSKPASATPVKASRGRTSSATAS